MDYLLDTNIYIYFLKGRYGLAEKIQRIGIENFYISEITVAELKYGIEKSTTPDKNRLVVYELIDKLKKLPIYGALDVYAKEKARLKKGGNIVDDFDLLIGATAIFNNMILVTNNEKHFTRLQNIKVENWVK